MAGNFNKVLLMGNLTRDIELRHTQSNTAIAKFGLAVNRRYSVGEGGSREQREETTFVDCEAWGRTAEVMSQYLTKGRPVFIEGRLRLDQWDDKTSGQKRSRLWWWSRTSSSSTRARAAVGAGARRAARAARRRAARSAGAEQAYDDIPPDDDIPF